MKYIKITTPDVNNGEGCRVTLWIPGCNHKCPGCHNEWAQNYFIGQEFTSKTYNTLVKELSKPYIAGLTLSGGDPLFQTDDTLMNLYDLISAIREDVPGKTIWLYTGFVYEELDGWKKRVADKCDVVVDGPFIEAEKDITLPFRGSKNQRILHIPVNK